jgi:hypothetical protein
MTDQPEKSLADYVAIALSPLLIMALVGSLVFFLLEVLYVGQFYGSLKWVLFFFVFGAVLLARLSMSSDTADRAPLYGIVLGGLVWIALQMWVEYPRHTTAGNWGWAINLGLIAIIWWSAHRLTWDCTLIDEEVDASGAGLLEVAGLEKASEASAPPAPSAEEEAKKKRKEPSGVIGWFGRFRNYREEQKRRPHAPGVWVVYFSLAALPLFGLGQSQIPPEDGERRRYTFWLMSIYVGSGLGLLLTTSFLGLRRYLRQRKLRMPLAMTGVWLFFGGLLLAAFLFVGAMLPRPGDPVPLLEWAGIKSQPRKGNKGAQVGEGGKQDGRDAKGKKNAEKQADGKDGKDGKDKDKKGKAGKDDPDAKDKGKDGGAGKDKQAKGGGRDRDPEEGEEDDAGQQGGGQAGSNPLGGETFSRLSEILKWIVIVIVIVVLVFFLGRALLQFLANFTHWADGLLKALSRWWQNLWRRKPKVESDASAAAEAAPPPFASFANPFAAGKTTLSPDELVRYSFAALEAWAWQRHLGRDVGETPLEFVHRISEDAPALEAEARRLADYYVGLAYGGRRLGRDCVEAIAAFWHMLTEVTERPLSAGSAHQEAV